MAQIEILMPDGVPAALAGAVLAKRVASLAGRRIGIVNNGWRCMDILASEYHDILLQEHGLADALEVRTSVVHGLSDADLELFVARCDAAIVGIGN